MENNRIPFMDLSKIPDSLQTKWQEAVAEIMKSGIFVSGKKVQTFEETWSRYIGMKYCVGVGNGYDALVVAIHALELKPQALIGVPAHTFIACFNAIISSGHTPVPLDVDGTGVLSVDSLLELDEKLDALMIVHMHGHSAPMVDLMEWARKNSCRVIEDCSQIHGGEINQQKLGSFGDISTFSFYPTKNLGAIGDAGCVLTNSEDLSKAMRMFANYGTSSASKYRHLQFGINSRLDPLQAAILLVNYDYLEEWNRNRQIIANRYINAIFDHRIKVMHEDVKQDIYHHFVVLSPERDSLRERFENAGISTEIHYPNLAAHEWESWHDKKSSSFPNAERIASNALSLPLHPWLTEKEINKICEAINALSVERDWR